MNNAELKINERWELWQAELITTELARAETRCPECKQPAYFCNSRKISPHFRSDSHIPGCTRAKKGRRFRDPSGKVCDFNAISDYREKSIKERKLKNALSSILDDIDKLSDDKSDSEDNSTDRSISVFKSCSKIFCFLQGLRSHDFVLDKDGSIIGTVNDILIDRRNIGEARKIDISGIRVIPLLRVKLDDYNPKLQRPSGYICLKDPYTADPDKAIYVFLRFREDDQGEIFKKKLMGDKNDPRAKDLHKYIVLTANLTKSDSLGNNVYITDPLTSKSYYFTNNIEPYYE